MSIKENLEVFIIYSTIGAILEHIMYWARSVKNPNAPHKALANPILTGFPIYGLGGLGVIWLSQIGVGKLNIGLRFLIYAIVLSIFELIIGLIVGAGKSSNRDGLIDSWDYSSQKYNILGIITPFHAIMWGLLAIAVEHTYPILLHSIKYGTIGV